MRLRTLATLPLRFYRRFLSPLKPPMCRFSPTCSQYAIDAVEVHGLWIGAVLAGWRLLRCQPFGKAGFDPVPPKGRAFARKHARCEHDATRDRESNGA